jgi:hypothetical protein
MRDRRAGERSGGLQRDWPEFRNGLTWHTKAPLVPWRMPEDACAPSGLELIALADEVILPRSLVEVCDLYHSARNPSNGNVVWEPKLKSRTLVRSFSAVARRHDCG